MDTATQDRAKTRGVSLFRDHEAIVDRAAKMRGLRGNTFSPAVQFILEDWARLRGITVGLPNLPGVDKLVSLPTPAAYDPITNPDDITDELPALAPAGNGAGA